MAEDQTRQAESAQQHAETTATVTSFRTREPDQKHRFFWGVGRRKKAIARVRIRPGSGTYTVNGREVDQYFTFERDRDTILSPLSAVNMKSDWDVHVNVAGGGTTGQAGAICLGLARALAEAIPEAEHALRDQGLMTRDARAKERKKYGQKGARKRFQFSKR
jgi:small subunit ribosomal protein S9